MEVISYHVVATAQRRLCRSSSAAKASDAIDFDVGGSGQQRSKLRTKLLKTLWQKCSEYIIHGYKKLGTVCHMVWSETLERIKECNNLLYLHKCTFSSKSSTCARNC